MNTDKKRKNVANGNGNSKRISLPVTKKVPSFSEHPHLHQTRGESLPTGSKKNSNEAADEKFIWPQNIKVNGKENNNRRRNDSQNGKVGFARNSLTEGENQDNLISDIKRDALTAHGNDRKEKSSSRAAAIRTRSNSHISLQKGKKATTKGEMCEALITAQTEYVEKLDKLIKVFVRPLSENHLTSKYRQTLFSNVKEVYTVHVGIQSDLEFSDRQDIIGVARTLTTHRNLLDVHGEYSYQLPRALNKIDELKATEPKVYSIITNAEIPSVRIRNLLTSVTEILPTYITTLEKLLKLTDRASSQHAVLEEALTNMREISKHSEVKVADLQIKEKLVKLQHELTAVTWGKSSLVTDFGRLLLEEELSVRRPGSAIDKMRHVILMDRIIIITKQLKSNSYVMEQVVELDRFSSVDETRSQRVRLEKPDGASLLLSADNRAATRKWFNAINQARDRIHPKEAMDDLHNFILYTFKELKECDACKLLLKGAYSQGYYCRRTNKQSHYECLEACKRLLRYVSEGRKTLPVPTEMPRCAIDVEAEKKCFGGYFGRVGTYDVVNQNVKPRTNVEIKQMLIDAVQNKLTLLKTGILEGGFRYTKVDLRSVNPVAPACFVMWESRNSGTDEQVTPKAGFIDHLCNQLTFKGNEIKLPDIEHIAHEYNGQINSYLEETTGELYVAGYYQEIDDIASSEDEEGLPRSLHPARVEGALSTQPSQTRGFLTNELSAMSNHRAVLAEDNGYTESKLARGLHNSDIIAVSSMRQSSTAAQQKKASSRLSRNSTNFSRKK